VSSYAHEAFQKPIERSPNFSRANRVLTPFFKSYERIPVYSFIQPIGIRAQKIRERIQPIEKRNETVYALAFFKNSTSIQKLTPMHRFYM